MASAPSSGSLIHTAPVASQGASALLSPFEAPGVTAALAPAQVFYLMHLVFPHVCKTMMCPI